MEVVTFFWDMSSYVLGVHACYAGRRRGKPLSTHSRYGIHRALKRSLARFGSVNITVEGRVQVMRGATKRDTFIFCSTAHIFNTFVHS